MTVAVSDDVVVVADAAVVVAASLSAACSTAPALHPPTSSAAAATAAILSLQPGERLYADTTTGDSPFYLFYYYYYYLFGEVQLYLTEECNDGSTCVAGDAGLSPQISYTNTSGVVETHYLGYECDPGYYGYYYDICVNLELQVVIE